ncbi:7390_t:CDS:2 [Acaulospora morrowiae]|uniref:7390_t:CDS:1 n=1 Tax=Acaulospora morrowiae TaxID=94023 RepID=A0A9N9BJJ4_9GLOM|nr:7390_t:CDS:2 [Acaulospora morrowiae]
MTSVREKSSEKKETAQVVTQTKTVFNEKTEQVVSEQEIIEKETVVQQQKYIISKEENEDKLNKIIEKEKQSNGNLLLVNLDRPVTVSDVLSGKVVLPPAPRKSVESKDHIRPILPTKDSQQDFLVIPDKVTSSNE